MFLSIAFGPFQKLQFGATPDYCIGLPASDSALKWVVNRLLKLYKETAGYDLTSYFIRRYSIFQKN